MAIDRSVSQQLEDEFACQHEQRTLRVKTLSNGTVQYRRQCCACGNGGVAIKKEDAAREMRLSDVPAYDEEAELDWYARRRARAAELRDQASEAWFVEAETYYHTAIWLQRRSQVFARDNYRCQAFLPGCTRRAEQVHHLSYAHWRNEPLFDLIAVCGECHKVITQMDRARRGAIAS